MTKLSVDDLIALKVQGVTADYVRQIKAAGFNGSIRELISLKVQGITPEFVEKVHSHGFKDLTFRQLIDLKMAGVF